MCALFLSVSLCLSVCLSLGGGDHWLSGWPGAVTGVHVGGGGGQETESRRHWAMSPGLGGASRSWEGEPQGPASTPGVEPMSPVSCGLRSCGAGDKPLTVALGAEP